MVPVRQSWQLRSFPSCVARAGCLVSQLEPRGNFSDAELRRLLQQCPLVSSLSMLSTERKSLSALAAFPQVTTLSLQQAQSGLDTSASWRRQLRGLSRLVSLRDLHIHNMQYYDISPVSALTGLYSLSVHEKSPIVFSSVDDLTEREVNSISVLHSLTHLQLSSCPPIKCIEALTNLRCLKFTGGFDVEKADSLSRLTRLDWNYKIKPTSVHGVRAAQSMTGLKHFCFKAVVLHGLEHFSTLTNLTTLKLDTCEAMHEHDISVLSTLTGLHDLTLQYWISGYKMQLSSVVGANVSVSRLQDCKYGYGEFFGQGM